MAACGEILPILDTGTGDPDTSGMNLAVTLKYPDPRQHSLVVYGEGGGMVVPYQVYVYPGVHADILNLTACVGFELWRLTTTWTVLLETAKASGVILLLGVGSLVCYKLYHRYRRPPPPAQTPSSKPGSKKSPASGDHQRVPLLYQDIDFDNIQREYFGPEYEGTAEDTGWLPNELLDLLEVSQRRFSDVVQSAFPCGPVDNDSSRFDMGNHSSSYSSKPVSYSAARHEIKFGYPSNNQRSPCPSPYHTSPHHRYDADGSELTDWRKISQSSDLDSINSFRSESPRDHPADYGYDDHQFIEHHYGKNWCRDADGESIASFEGSIQRSLSLCGNCSPQSILDRHLLYSSGKFLLSERLPPEGSTDEFLVYGEYEKSIEKSPELTTIVRDPSFGSECSEFSLPDVTTLEDICRSSAANFDRLENCIESIKRDCQDLDLEFSSLTAYRNPPPVFSVADLVKTPLSDISEDASLTSLSAKQLVDVLRNRVQAARKGIVQSRSFEKRRSLLRSSSWAEGSILPESNESPSLEWEPLNCDSGSDFGSPILEDPANAAEERSSGCNSLEWEEEFKTSNANEKENQVDLSLISIPVLEEALKQEAAGWTLSQRDYTKSDLDLSIKFRGSLGRFDPATLSMSLPDLSTPSWILNEVSDEATSNDDEFSVHTIKKPDALTDSGYMSVLVSSQISESGVLTQMNSIENVGARRNISDYALLEWQGNTIRAKTIRQGYHAVVEKLGFNNLRRIRGDNYCAIRAALFQTMCEGVRVMGIHGGADAVGQKLTDLLNAGNNWLLDWSFARRLSYDQETCLQGMITCLHQLEKVSELISSSADREEEMSALLNTNPALDVQLMEATKLLMLIRGAELYDSISCDRPHVPLYASLMFVRSDCATPHEFLTHRLNTIGDSGGLEQVEMYLLSDVLGVHLDLVRPSHYGRGDFVCSLSESSTATRPPTIYLISEDDRHYNILVS